MAVVTQLRDSSGRFVGRLVTTHTRTTESQALTKSQIIAELARSSHGQLDDYLRVGVKAAVEDPEFFAHLIAWNEKNGQIRDSKKALPICQLATLEGVAAEGPGKSTLVDNALAHLALLDPKDLLETARWAHKKVSRFKMARLVKAYLRAREKSPNWWDKTVLAHRVSMKNLYGLYHVKASDRAAKILYRGKYPPGSAFEAVAKLGKVGAQEAADLIVEHRLPLLTVLPHLSKYKNDTGFVAAMIDRMSSVDLVNNTKLLEKLGLNNSPVLRAAYDEKLSEVAKSKKAAFKATQAAEHVKSDRLTARLQGVQEKQADLQKVDGKWLIICDKSGSMHEAIEVARVITGAMSRVAEESHLVFADTSARYLNVTGWDYDRIVKETSLVTAGGGTSIGVGLDYLLQRGIEVDGIVIVSDAAENSGPAFARTYRAYTERFGKAPSVYLYKVRGEYSDRLIDEMKSTQQDMTIFDLTSTKIDRYSLTNLIATMRSNKYSLVDEIMSTPLLTVEGVFRK